MTKIGSNIKKIRSIKNISQQAFADIFSLNRGNISSYEENRAEPKLDSIISIANYFSIPLEDLLTKDLTVNEILQFNADKLIEDELKMNALKIRTVPFINDDIFVKGLHQEISFLALKEFPELKIPETSTHNLLAVQFNDNITHHEFFEDYSSDIIMYFKEVSTENYHLINGKQGLYLQAHKLTLGLYEQSKKQALTFVVNEKNTVEVDPHLPMTFWKLFASYRQVAH